jgi:large subunit ribosomal protein L23
MERQVIKSPHISEKESAGTRIFKIDSRANRREVKLEVEKIYKVKVKKVNIINVLRKKRRLGRTLGYRAGFKKAIVILEHGQTFTDKKEK